jgi:hypothetical protein
MADLQFGAAITGLSNINRSSLVHVHVHPYESLVDEIVKAGDLRRQSWLAGSSLARFGKGLLGETIDRSGSELDRIARRRRP